MTEDEVKDITLIYPYRTWDKFTNTLNGSFHPLGLHCISAYLRKHGYRTEVTAIASGELTGYLDRQAKKTRMIGFSCIEDNLQVAVNAIKYLKKRYDMPVLIGGPQALHLNSDFLQITGCDVVMKGEGEYAMKALLDYYQYGIGSLEQIHGLLYSLDGEVIDTGIADIICDLDELPFPDVDYGETQTVAQIITGRGCPNHCSFCFDGGNSRKVRYRSVENVTKELDTILEHFPQITTVQFVDDTFMLRMDRAEQVCEYFERIRKTRPVQWICEANVNNLYKNPDMIERMVKAGLIAMQIGIESGSDTVLKAYNKPSNTEMIQAVFKICREKALRSLEGQIIVGGAFESDETIQQDCDLVKSIIRLGRGMTDINTVFLWPYPHTAITDHPENFGLHIDQRLVEHSIVSLKTPVTYSEEMSTNRIIYAKKMIDSIISSTYHSECLLMTADEVRKFYNKKEQMFTGKWGAYLKSYDHIKVFMVSDNEMLVKQLADYDLDELYPVRTFSSLQYNGTQLKFYNFKFSELEQSILENSTGKISMQQIAGRLKVSRDVMVNTVMNLYNRCLLSFSLC